MKRFLCASRTQHSVLVIALGDGTVTLVSANEETGPRERKTQLGPSNQRAAAKCHQNPGLAHPDPTVCSSAAFEGKTWSCFYEHRMSVKMNGEPRTERYHPVTGGFRRPPPGLGAAALAASGRAPAWARLVQSQPPGEFLSEVSLCEAGGAAGTGRGAEARCWVTDAEPRLGHVGWQGWQGLVTSRASPETGHHARLSCR